MKNKKIKEIKDYDYNETVNIIDKTNPLKLSDLDIELPKEAPTKVISLRLPKELLNKIQAFASQQDISYTAVIKMLLSEGIDQKYIQKST
ncbi:CopG family antitoxin [Caminibacter pacificus]